MNRDKISKHLMRYLPRHIAELLADEILASQWISVEDELPGRNGCCRVWCGFEWIAKWDGLRWSEWNTVSEDFTGSLYPHKVTHWILVITKQPPPAPPETDESNS